MQETIVAKDQKTISNEMQCLLLKVRLSTTFSLKYAVISKHEGTAQRWKANFVF